MKAIKVTTDNLYLKIFKAEQHDVICFVYYDKQGNVASFNYHWGVEEIQPEYLKYQPDAIETQLYKGFKEINGGHEVKLLDYVIEAKTLLSLHTTADNIKLVNDARAEADQWKQKYNELNDKVNKAKNLIQ
jgi:hypothetical protein